MRLFKGKILQQQLSDSELEALVNDFRRYKTSGELPDTFGRDVAYDHPYNLPLVRAEGVQHIHLADNHAPWPHQIIQYHRTSDVHLAYCQGAIHNNHYLLIAILSPDAHKQARDNNTMLKLGKAAEQFRLKF
ncbi:MAG: type II toxin-antitoxin system YafO family toxin [Marinobacterium sp.]|nr:type II toxin-antitoxin system YafO family toxin [Marinobacterium sp.]